MRYELCTLFDRNYILKGLALHESLCAHASDFRLWILCMDDVTYEILRKIELQHVELVSLADFEDPKLAGIKGTRTAGEYCWTCTPSLPLYLLNTHPELEMVTYLDADLFFYGDPAPIFDEFGDASIGLVEHRHAPGSAHLAPIYGTYNVECMIFRNDGRGRAALEWWRERCIEWCYARVEDGKWADQMYLEDWPERFEGVRVLQHKGVGLAPWNIAQHRVHARGGEVIVDDTPLVFYHFHQFSMLDDKRSYRPALSAWGINASDVELVYRPYAESLWRALELVRTFRPEWEHGFESRSPRTKVRDALATVIPAIARTRRFRPRRR